MKALALAALLVLSACAAPAARERFYTLVPPVEAAPAPASGATASALSIHVGPVSVPEDVDRPQMVLRSGPHTVEIDEYSRWAEPLKAAIPKAIAEALSRELGTARVFASRLGANAAVDVRVAIEVRRFESSLAGGATLEAIWTVSGAKGAARSGRSLIREPAPTADPAGIAAAHGRSLARLAAEIAAEVRSSLPRG